MSNRGEVRVLVIASDPLARAGLAALLADQPECRVVGQASPADDLAPLLAAFQPDVIVWDWGWDAAGAPESLSLLADEGAAFVVVLGDESQFRAVWTAGARCVVGRLLNGEQLAAAVQAVHRGLTVIEPTFLPALAAPARSDGLLVEPLTEREMDVLRRMAEGMPNKLIARELGISEHTVKYHVNAILGKLGAQSRTDAVVRATRAGLILL
jgi:DNA-binding NarL/FixJ family response regulator